MTGLSGPTAYDRAADLLQQAFATEVRNVGDPWASEPHTVPVLSSEERALYVAAAQAYAALAQAAATIEQAASRGPGDFDLQWLRSFGIPDPTEPPL
jgi:hypothetical protein